MSINEERNRLLGALARMVETGEALIEASRNLTTEGLRGDTFAPNAATLALVATGRAKLEAALAEAKDLLAASAVREPVVVEVMNKDGTVVSRVEK